jgi:hypothetical protein
MVDTHQTTAPLSMTEKPRLRRAETRPHSTWVIHCWNTDWTSVLRRARRQIFTSSIFPWNQLGQTAP